VLYPEKELSPCTGTPGDSFAFGADGTLHRAGALAQGLGILGLTIRNNGDAYAVTGDELWLIRAGGERVKLDQNLKGASGVALSPDGLWLFVAQNRSRNGLSYRVKSDGTVDAREPLYDFYVPAWADDSGATGVAMDRDGRAYVGTLAGVQVFDRNGRVVAILPLPGNAAVTSLCFGSKDFDSLYVAGGGRVYRRKLQVRGAPPWDETMKLPPWGAG
jgi:gluconolactonase